MSNPLYNQQNNHSIEFSIQWKDKLVQYCDRYYLLKVNFWRDIFPPVLDFQIKRAKLSQTVEIDYPAGELLLQEYSNSNVQHIAIKQFNSHHKGFIPIIPVTGRFYPKGMIDGVAGCFKEDTLPFRIIDQDERGLLIDMNHPLATFPLKLTASIRDIYDASQQKGGRCNDIADVLTTNGPGMQSLLVDKNTDFFTGMPFSRVIEDQDALFYEAIETVDSVDMRAIRELKTFYVHTLKDGMKILDLLAGPDSRLPDEYSSLDVTGLGLKVSDLEANESLSRTVQHDVNACPELPFKDQQFDAVICSFAIEYIIHPEQIFQQIARILKPNGVFSIGFSDRFYTQKVIRLWEDIHVFERIGVVLEYFRQNGQFDHLYCESIRGLIRDEDDPFKAGNVFSCPMFMLSGVKGS